MINFYCFAMAVLTQILPFVLIFSVTFCNTSGRLYDAFNQYDRPPFGEITEADAQLPVWKTMQQYVDNFDPQNTAMWPMRYLENDQFYKPGGPIFIFLVGQTNTVPSFLMQGPMHRMAKEHQGMMYSPEHRFYGHSMPTPDCTLKNLKYLSADQALEDLAKFIVARKEELFAKNNGTDKRQNKVVVVGVYYGGNLATWARMKYPHLIQAAWASSATVKAVGDFYEFNEVVGESLGLANQTCLNVVQEAVSQIENLIETPSGQEIIKKVFRISAINFNDPQQRSLFFYYYIARHFWGVLQFDGTLGPLKLDCNILLAEKGKSYEKLAALISRVKPTLSFASSYEEVNDLNRGWNCSERPPRTYQACTEYGQYATTNSTKQPFGKYMMLDFFVEYFCIGVFGKNFNEAALDRDIYRTNVVYGSTKPDVTRVVSIHGSLNPCHSLGVLEDLNEDAPAIVMEGITNVLDVFPIKDKNLHQVINAQNRARNLISKWLQ